MIVLIILKIINPYIVNANIITDGLSAIGSVASEVGNTVKDVSSEALLGELQQIADGGKIIRDGTESNFVNSIANTVMKNVVGTAVLKASSGITHNGDFAFYNFMYPENDDYPWACICDESDYEEYIKGKKDKVRCRNYIDSSLQNAVLYCNPANHNSSINDNANNNPPKQIDNHVSIPQTAPANHTTVLSTEVDTNHNEQKQPNSPSVPSESQNSVSAPKDESVSSTVEGTKSSS